MFPYRNDDVTETLSPLPPPPAEVSIWRFWGGESEVPPPFSIYNCGECTDNDYSIDWLDQ